MGASHVDSAPARIGRRRSQSNIAFIKGQLLMKRKRLLGDSWPTLFFQLDNEGGSVQLKASQAEGAKLVGMWSVTGVNAINDRPKKQPNRIDVTTSSGTVALSAATLEDKRAWLHALRDALGQT